MIAFDPELSVDMSHVWRNPRVHFRRQRLGARTLAAFADLPRYRLRDCVREWWSGLPDDRHSPWLYRLDVRRMAGLAGKYAGHRDTARSR